MKNLKITIAVLMLITMICSLCVLFNEHTSEQLMWFVMFTFNASAIIAHLALKSINQ